MQGGTHQAPWPPGRYRQPCLQLGDQEPALGAGTAGSWQDHHPIYNRSPGPPLVGPARARVLPLAREGGAAAGVGGDAL